MTLLRQTARNLQALAYLLQHETRAEGVGVLVMTFDRDELARGENVAACALGPRELAPATVAALLRAFADVIDPKREAPPLDVRAAPFDASDLEGFDPNDIPRTLADMRFEEEP